MWLILVLPYYIEMFVLNGSSVDPDRTPRFAASDLSLQCLQRSILCNAKHK